MTHKALPANSVFISLERLRQNVFVTSLATGSQIQYSADS